MATTDYLNAIALIDGTVPPDQDARTIALLAELATRHQWALDEFNDVVNWYYNARDRDKARSGLRRHEQ